MVRGDTNHSQTPQGILRAWPDAITCSIVFACFFFFCFFYVFFMRHLSFDALPGRHAPLDRTDAPVFKQLEW